jgi:hypothetical protein
LSIQVLHRNDVAPDNLIGGQIENGRHGITLFRTWGPSAQDDGGDSAFVEAALLRKLSSINSILLTYFR